MNEVIRSNIDLLKTITEEHWKDVLETDCDGAKNRLLLEEDYLTLLDTFPRQIRSCILEPYGVPNTRELPPPLDNPLKSDILVLSLLKEYMSQLIRDVTLEYLKDALIERDYWDTVSSMGMQNRLILALLLSSLNAELLHMCLLVSRCERYGYEEYILLMDMERVLDPLRQAELRQVEIIGIDTPNITATLIDDILERYEAANNTNLSSTCLKVINYQDEIVVFILRESQRSGLRTFRRYIVDMNADLIVLRFSPTLKDLRVRAVNIVREDVYLTIANNIVVSNDPRIPANFVKKSYGNALTVFQTFIQELLSENIPGVEMNHIEMVVPLPGRPALIIERKSSEVSLLQSMSDDRRNIDLSSLIPDSKIKKVKVTYTVNRKPHIFTLQMSESADQIYVMISGNGGGIRKRRTLISLLDDYTNIRILESKEK